MQVVKIPDVREPLCSSIVSTSVKVLYRLHRIHIVYAKGLMFAMSCVCWVCLCIVFLRLSCFGVCHCIVCCIVLFFGVNKSQMCIFSLNVAWKHEWVIVCKGAFTHIAILSLQVASRCTIKSPLAQLAGNILATSANITYKFY